MKQTEELVKLVSANMDLSQTEKDKLEHDFRFSDMDLEQYSRSLKEQNKAFDEDLSLKVGADIESDI